ncbi:MAG: DUF1566 domain-containing protein [Desulfobacterales bacterium]|nr:DUF1566 domain-containing protein [Desulfobacterales bacterium]MDD3951323.1 DUF1566 domain-containing protein [Desulfobacterales bacterium]
MERENFYLLLNLSADPPEEDPRVIDDAIRNKQAEWSRRRSHPTKSLQSQRYIALIPEIRRVMGDDNLRRKEAAGACRDELTRINEKLAEIDRHLRVRMSKGFVSEDEIANLAASFGFPADQLRVRVIELETDKLAKIDRQIEMRMWKGYVTEKEVARLAEDFGALKSIIRSRIRCILLQADPVNAPKVEPLDASLTSLIQKNLSIIGKDSLYAFLELPSGSDIETLQRKAADKQAEMLRSARKDALVTAAAELAGVCLSVFGRQKSRLAYDVYRARSLLSKLDAAIDASVENGVICREYFESLIRNAADLDMDYENAAEYIRQHCRKKGWLIEPSRRKRFGPRHYLAAAIGAAMIIFAGVFFFFGKETDLQQENYQALIIRSEGVQQLEDKLDLLNEFLRRFPESRFAPDVIKMKSALLSRLEGNAFDEMMNISDALIRKGEYQTAVENMKGYLGKYPGGLFSEQVRDKMQETSKLEDEEDYRRLGSLPDFGLERLQHLRRYLADHPEGERHEEVAKRIADMHGEFLLDARQEISRYESEQDWANCIQVCDRFLEVYPQSSQAVFFKERRRSCAGKLKAEAALARLQEKVDAQKNDPEAAVQVYLDFLKIYPDFEFRDRIETQISLIHNRMQKERIERERQAIRGLLGQGDGRFVEKTAGVVADVQTGLMWSLLDSDQELERCLTYDEALEYVKNLRTGGYEDWRLPKSEELGGIYKRTPFFPSVQFRRYWTSQNYMSYADRWRVRFVQVVTSDNEIKWKPQQVEAENCCSIRAVRP